jgi:hypothetical protein
MNLQTFPDSHPVAFAVILGLFAVITFCLSLAMVSLAGGWHELSKRFRLDNPFDGITEGMQSGRMRFFGNSKNSLRLGADAEGLYLSVPALFRFMHPPLFVPWREIEIHHPKAWLFGEYVTLTLGNDERIPLRIGGSAALMLEEAAGTSWPKERSGT